ncbi:ATP-dependent metallopeptidase FtsH/Yme1/Tma family protein [Persicimonas caeni]|uniref:ATP-dependent zinc metalloprotease FtsH n=1 Tax=Persicimonas caeni TaxID=2292766 RepID=A0A4Y6Q2P6_PERCE|nr:ATP-dependent metallopeptidase FtsH/Yme1/Tma family protein [Persicimonas caeni]QED36048.1 ATP-dependent metallopeptidase FtsH/Yme1/Tma family protein [Persicimonas caeni]
MIWGVLIVLGIIVFQILTDRTGDSSQVKFSEFRQAAQAGEVESVKIKDLEVTGEFTEDYAEKEHDGKQAFKTVGPVGEDLQDILMAKDVTFSFVKSDENSLWRHLLVTAIPLLILVVVLIFIMRQFQGGSGKAMTFGKSRARLLNESNNKITFNDIAGIEEAKEELQEVVEFLKNPKKFTRLGGRIPKGVLLMGKPGTGKTLLARGVAGEAGVPFFSISGSDFVEMFVGVGASRVRDLFEQGKKNAPCIIFIDEIDAVGRQRGSGLGGGHDEREQTLNQLLVEMDGFESNDGVILIAATNRPDVLDPALLRPGRFDRRVVVPPPDVRGRELILQIHTRRTPVAKDVELESIARGTPGFSGADLENLVNEAALLAARRNKDRVELEDFEDAKDKVMMGAERKSAVITDAEKRVTAYHEAGHALVALLQEGTDPVHKVTIIPRGRALGVTQQLPEEDRHTMRRDYVLKRLAVMMGGRAAELVVFDEITTGAGNDIQVATDMTRKMVCEWGMSDRIGPLAYTDGDNNPFLGGNGGITSRPYSESIAKEIDAEVKRIVTEQHDLAVQLLRDNMDLLELMAQALLEFEALDANEIQMLLEDESLEGIREAREAQKKEREEREDERVPKTGYKTNIKDNKNKGAIGNLAPSANS